MDFHEISGESGDSAAGGYRNVRFGGGGTPTRCGHRQFDIQAHRGGIGLTVESTLSFGTAVELGVTTLELDLQIIKDGREVITHDRKANAAKCLDTAPATSTTASTGSSRTTRTSCGKSSPPEAPRFPGRIPVANGF